MGAETIATYISRKGFERREWLSFLYPLKANVWIYLLLNAFVLLIFLKGFEMYYYRKAEKKGNLWNPLVILGDFWMLGALYFGRSSSRGDSDRERSIRILLLVAFLSGTLVFMSYRASLTAELSVKRQSLPFTNAEELLNSDYRYIYNCFLYM